MTTSIALVVFLLGLGVALLSSEFLVRGLGRLGAKVGLAAGLLGLLTALGADAPEISSAVTALLSGAKDVGLGVILGSNLFNLAALLGLSSVVAGALRFPRVLVLLDGGIALYATVIVVIMFVTGLAPLVGLLLLAVVFVAYVLLLAAQPHVVARLPGSPHRRHRLQAVARLVHQDLAQAEPLLDRESSWAPVWWVGPSVIGIVAGSYGMVNAALVLGTDWHIPHAVLGNLALAALTSLPNAYAASRLALLNNGTAVLSLSFNSNTLNLIAGVGIPAVLIGGVVSEPGAQAAIIWLLAMTLLAIGLGWWQRGLTRLSGLLLILVYVGFVAYILR